MLKPRPTQPIRMSWYKRSSSLVNDIPPSQPHPILAAFRRRNPYYLEQAPMGACSNHVDVRKDRAAAGQWGVGVGRGPGTQAAGADDG